MTNPSTPAHAAPQPAPDSAPVGWDGIISARALASRLGDAHLVVLDCRFDLAQPDLGERQYLEGHIPGAVYAHLDRDLSGPRTESSGRHPLPDRHDLAARLQSWGVGPASQVVAYDANEGSFAARAWWLLRWLGHAQVAVLDGGWPAWNAAALPVSSHRPSPTRGTFCAGASLQSVVAMDEVLAHAAGAGSALGAPSLLLDARAPDRFAGRNETIDPVAGHIPGAVNRFWKHNLDAHGRFKPPVQLRDEYLALLDGRPPAAAIVQCGSGVTACHDLLSMHIAGLQGAALYAGSWSQWITDPARPIVQGA